MSKINMGKWNLEESSVIGPQHDPIVMSCQIKSGTTQLPAGTILSAEESTGELEVATSGKSIFGILARDFHRSEGNQGNVLIHGAANRRTLETVKGQALTPQEVICLIKSGIYPF